MILPNFPTDNLYKFVSIFGLVLVISSVYFYRSYRNELSNEIINYRINLEIFNKNKERDSTLNFNRVISNEKIRFKHFEKDLLGKVQEFPNLTYGYITLTVVGLILVFVGFGLWFHRTQKLHDGILMIESKRINNEKNKLIHQFQFKKEFKIYNKLWTLLIELNDASYVLSPLVENLQSDDLSKVRESWSMFKEKFEKCEAFFQKNKPFYSPSIYKKMKTLIEIAFEDAFNNIIDKNKNTMTLSNLIEIKYLTNGICEEIRKRIGVSHP